MITAEDEPFVAAVLALAAEALAIGHSIELVGYAVLASVASGDLLACAAACLRMVAQSCRSPSEFAAFADTC